MEEKRRRTGGRKGGGKRREEKRRTGEREREREREREGRKEAQEGRREGELLLIIVHLDILVALNRCYYLSASSFCVYIERGLPNSPGKLPFLKKHT